MGSLSLSVRKIAFAWRTHAVRWPDWHGTLRKIGYRCNMYARSCKLELTEVLSYSGYLCPHVEGEPPRTLNFNTT